VRRSILLGRPLAFSGAVVRVLLARSLWAVVPVAVVALAPSTAMADSTTGIITGSVTDGSTKRAIADVVVEVVSAATGEQVVVTDSSGSYRIPNLAPGAYTIRVANDGYRPASSTVTLNANQTIRADVRIMPLALQAQEIVVVGKAPSVDVGSAQTGTTITKDFTSRIPVSRPGGKGGAARSFESVAEVTPGAKNDGYGVSINGTTSPENAYLIDGLSVNNPAYGIVGTPLSIEFTKEVGVISGGYMPEYGRSTGGVLNVVTKSGGNEFHGSVFVNFSPGSLEGQKTKVRDAGQTLSADRTVDLVHDFGAEVGGPILKDRLWFYGGLSFNSTRYRVEQNLNRRVIDPTKHVHPEGAQCASPDGMSLVPCSDYNQFDFVKDANGDPITEVIPGTRNVRPAVERGIQYIGKLNFAVSPDHQLELAVYGAPTVSGGEGGWGIDPDRGVTEGTLAGDYTSYAHKYVSESTDVSAKWTGAFDNKTLNFEASVGWHHQRAARLPADGSALGSQQGTAGLPSVQWQKSSPIHNDITKFVDVPGGAATCEPGIVVMADLLDANLADADHPDGKPGQDGVPETRVARDPQCPASTYFAGGPDFIDDQSLDRYYGKIIGSKVFQGLGHHVLKAGLDFEQMSYVHTKAYTGHVRLAENGSGSAFNESRSYGFLTGPDSPIQVNGLAGQDKQTAASTSTTVGAFVQDSWNVMDKVTLNLGVRWDGQFLFGADGKLGMALPAEFSPRVGIIYDITQQGRSKIFANFARYYESIPLDLVDRAFPGEAQIVSRHYARNAPDGKMNCDPSDPAQLTGICRDDITRQSRGRVFGNSFDPNQFWAATGAAKVPVDPNLQPQASDEIVVGGEYELFQDGRLGLQYTHRYMVNIIEDMSRDEATTYFIGNPGSGIAKDFPTGKRDYDGVTLFFTKTYADKWLAQVSYTLSFLRGNIAGLYRPETNQLDPNINSDFDLTSLTVNRYGPLPGDNTHEIKVFAARDFPFNEFFNGPDYMQLNLGVSYRGTSGGPTSFLGAHPIYGNSEVHILPRGSGVELPFVHRFDGHVQYDVKLSKDSALSISMDIFNIFNFQETTLIDEDYTFSDVLPLKDGKPITTADGKRSPDPTLLRHADGTPFELDPQTGQPIDKNPNFGNPVQYQAPRSFRFGAKVTF
jgi:hypothetical protein